MAGVHDRGAAECRQGSVRVPASVQRLPDCPGRRVVSRPRLRATGHRSAVHHPRRGAVTDREVEAARRLEVLLDRLGCLSSRPAGYLLDPAYRGLLSVPGASTS